MYVYKNYELSMPVLINFLENHKIKFMNLLFIIILDCEQIKEAYTMIFFFVIHCMLIVFI